MPKPRKMGEAEAYYREMVDAYVRPEQRTAPSSPAQYYANILQRLTEERKLSEENKEYLLDEYRRGNVVPLDQALALYSPGYVKEPGAWGLYQLHRTEETTNPEVRPWEDDPTRRLSEARVMSREGGAKLTEQLVAALKAAKEVEEARVPPPDTPTYRKPRPEEITVEIGPAQDITTEDIKKRIQEARQLQEQAHKFMLGRPKYG